MIIFLDADYKCHVEDDGTMRAYETEFFNGKCKAFIEGYRLVPEGEVWIREDGEAFGPQGESVFPWRSDKLLREFQAQYEDMQAEAEQLKAQNAEYEAALTEIENALGVSSE